MLIYSLYFAVSSTLLLVVTSTLGDGETQETGQPGDIQDPCSLKEKNISLASLSFPYYEGYNTLGNDSIKIYLSLCKPLSELPERIAALCDKTAFSCITKFDNRKVEVEYIRNGGSVSTGVREEVNHLALELREGEKCDSEFKKENVSTRIDFFCSSNSGSDQDNTIIYEGVLGECQHQIFWHSSLACWPEQKKNIPSSSCVVRVPGYDAIIDLSVWATEDGHFLARSISDTTGEKELYHLNLCRGVTHSPCPSSSILCRVNQDETEILENIANLTDHHSIEYIPETETISVNYPGALLPVTINIKCDRDALKPQVFIESDTPKGVVLRFQTVGACLVPAIQCVTQDNEGNIYDLSSLKTMEWEIGVSNEKQSRYQIKVCGSLPISPENPCREQAGICSYSFMTNSTRMVEPHNLGIMYKRPVVNEDGDISLEYSHGTKYSDNKGNSCNMSSEIILKCSDRELGPRFEEATACKHTLIWSTPAACPQQKQVSHDCTVREPLFSNLFNLSSLHSTTDYILRGEEENYILNVCGPLISDCSNTTCLESGERLTYLEGSLEMNIRLPTCPADTNSTLDARIVFLCNHEIERGAPELVVERDCELEIEWKTSLACPPHQEVQCSLPTMDGVIDLSSLSLPHQNYQVESDTGEIFLLNVCRSLVHNNQSRCPYQAAACLLNSEDTIDANIGEVDSSLHLDEDGNPIITYTLGSLCKDPESRLGHTQTSIKFLCDPERFDSEPEFLEVFDCHFSFQWINAAACPVQTSMGNCSVTSPQSGFTFDLSSLNKPEGWRWTDTGHHMINQLDLNVCGALPSSICADGGGVCDSSGLNLGQANSNLTYSEEQLFLTYSEGVCPGNTGSTSETRIKFICPPRRQLSSGNAEVDGPKSLHFSKSGNICHLFIDFFTDLACDHQVYCDVRVDNTVLELTKLRRHDANYKTMDRDGNEFLLNVCGPLVVTDVPRSGCNPQGVCGYYNGDYVGMGKVLSSPQVVANGHIELRYEEGDICDGSGGTWSSTIYFTCAEIVDPKAPFGTPRLVSLDSTNCEAVFKVATILACANTSREMDIHEPDSCKIYHPGRHEYIDLSNLEKPGKYIVQDPTSQLVKYEIQPCGSVVSSCGGSVCKVEGRNNFSLGKMSDVKYFPESEELRVRYLEGDLCGVENKRFMTKIYYSCDPSAGVGSPSLDKNGKLACMIIFNWRTIELCTKEEIDRYRQGGGKVVDVDIKDTTTVQELVPPKTGMSWGHIIIVLMVLVGIAGGVYIYRTPGARERGNRTLQELRARLPVVLGGRSRNDSTLLVSSPGALFSDEDEYS